MDESFEKNLKLGFECEERVARFLEGKGFRVLNIGSFKLPIDLFVSNGEVMFWVQVKFRNDIHPRCPIWIHRKQILEVTKKGGIPIILILEFREELFQIHLEGKKVKLGLPKPCHPWPFPIDYIFKNKKGEAYGRRKSLIYGPRLASPELKETR